MPVRGPLQRRTFEAKVRRSIFEEQRPLPLALQVSEDRQEELDRLMSQAQFVAAVQEGMDDIEAGRVLGHDELGRRLDARFGPLTEPK